MNSQFYRYMPRGVELSERDDVLICGWSVHEG